METIFHGLKKWSTYLIHNIFHGLVSIKRVLLVKAFQFVSKEFSPVHLSLLIYEIVELYCRIYLQVCLDLLRFILFNVQKHNEIKYILSQH